MSLPLRLLLIIVPILVQIYVVIRIRKLKLKAVDASYWIVFSAVLVILGLFPSLTIVVANLIGVQSPANLVFLVIIALLCLKVFSLSAKIAILEKKEESLAHTIALKENEDKKSE